MIQAPDLPFWAALVVALLLLTGAGLTLLGAVGLLRLRSFYQRVHAPTLGATAGVGCLLLGSILCFSVLENRPVLHEVLIAFFLTITTPITLMLLARAALYRDRVEGAADIPPDGGQEETER